MDQKPSKAEIQTKTNTRTKTQTLPPPAKKLDLFDLLVAFVFPTLVGKSFVMYFGLNYSNYPGEGYGIGLTISILFTLCMVARFIWKYRNYED